MTSLETIAPYLPYGIEVEVCRSKRGTLVALAMGQISMRVMADVVVPANGPDADLYSLSDTMPVLFDFADLTKQLPDGTVPVDEIRKLWGLQAMNGIEQHVYNEMVLSILHGKEIGSYAMSIDVTFEDVAASTDYLRSKHFALPVNGKPLVQGVDFIRKEL